MERSQLTVAASPSSSSSYQSHPARAAIIDLFNLYFGIKNRQNPDEYLRDSQNRSQNRVHASSRDLPPRNEQFILDFEQLQSQFNEPDQLRTITESVLTSLVVQCSNHAPRVEFLLFALPTFCRNSYTSWDTFLPSLLSSVSAAEASISQSVQASSTRAAAINSLRQLCCKIMLIGVESNLKPVTHAVIFQYMMNWLTNWDCKDLRTEDSAGNLWRSDKHSAEWLRSCLDVILLLVEERKSRIPFYELLRCGIQFIENMPDDDSLFTLIMEIHRRQDAMAVHMLMLDQHLHCPTFDTNRLVSEKTADASDKYSRHSPITYPSILGEPLCGEDLAISIPKGSRDWERAMRCTKHAIRTMPSKDWWEHVLVLAPCYRHPPQPGSVPGAVFSSEMICEAIIDRIVELIKLTNSDANCWQEWLVFSDTFFFLIKKGCSNFFDFIDQLVLRLNSVDNHILRTNHVTWLLAQVIRVRVVMSALNSDAKKMETTRQILSFHREDRNSDPNNPQSVMLDFISICLNIRIWKVSPTTEAYLLTEQLSERKQLSEWWRSKGEHIKDYMNMDDRSIGMFWLISYCMSEQACETVMKWLSSAGMTELLGIQSKDRITMIQEVTPLPMSLISGFSMNLCLGLSHHLEEALFVSEVVPSVAMVETYTRLLLIFPHSMFRSHFVQLHKINPSLINKAGVLLLVLEILNYRLLPLYRYQGEIKSLLYDVTKIISALKGRRGAAHRLFRLAENVCMNLILSLRDFFSVKREEKGPNVFTETLNRVTIVTLAITIKTRGLSDSGHLVSLQTMLEHILSTSQHTWSEKTLQYFPSLLRDTLSERVDNRSLSIQAWQQVERTVMKQCTQLLSPSAEPSDVLTYLNHSSPQHRQYLCSGACLLMQGHRDNINSANLVQVLGRVSPEEVTANIYTLVDVLLHHIHIDLQKGQALEAVLEKAGANLIFFFLTLEMLPPDIFLLALIDRDDDPHALIIAMNLLNTPDLLLRIKDYCQNRGPPEHWLVKQVFKRNELKKALGNLSWKDRYPTFFDDIAAHLLPVIPLVVYRLIENNEMEKAENLLLAHSHFIAYHPLRFTLVRDILAYFYGHLSRKLVMSVLKLLDLSKIPFSESFLQYISPVGVAVCPPLDYFTSLLLNLVNNVIPPLSSSGNCSSRCGPIPDILNSSGKSPHGETPGTSQPGPGNASEGQKAFYQIQDPGTYTQLVLETAVIEILSLPISSTQIVSSLVKIIVNIQSTLIESGYRFRGAANGMGQGSVPTPSSGGSTDSMTASPSTSFFSRSSYTSQQLSCLLIQACGLLLAQLPPDFHMQLYLEASHVIRETWWLKDWMRPQSQLDSAVGYALMDPTLAASDNTSTAIGNIVALLHALFYNLPLEWLDGTNDIIENLRPVKSVAMLRVVFRIMGPLLSKLANSHTLFRKTLDLLLTTLVDVFGKNAQTTVPVEASQIADLIDFIHHIIHYEGQGGAVETSSKPRLDILALIGKAADSLRPDVQQLLAHLNTDPNSSIYAAAHQKTENTNTS